MSRNDPATYRQMCEPHPDYATANAALQAFWDGVEELRKKHRIADVHVIAEIRYGAEHHRAQGDLHLGDTLQQLPMLARAYGGARALFENMIETEIKAAERHRGR